jgi:hypothetical protein
LRHKQRYQLLELRFDHQTALIKQGRTDTTLVLNRSFEIVNESVDRGVFKLVANVKLGFFAEVIVKNEACDYIPIVHFSFEVEYFNVERQLIQVYALLL